MLPCAVSNSTIVHPDSVEVLLTQTVAQETSVGLHFVKVLVLRGELNVHPPSLTVSAVHAQLVLEDRPPRVPCLEAHE